MKSFDKTQDLRIALVHDYIKEYGGAERVLEALHEIWPTSPVYTTVYLPEFLGPHKERFKNWDIRTSFLQYLPLKAKLISPFRIISPFVFKSFDFSQFDVVIVSATGAYIPNTIQCHPEPRQTRRRISLQSSGDSSVVSLPQNDKKKRLIHICYCHTPPRYFYGYATARNWNKSIILGSIGKMFNHFLRLVDFKSAQNVDYFIANSKNVAGRIKKFYRRDSKVIYPPVEVDGRRWKIEDSTLKIEDRRSIHPQASTLKNLPSTFYHPSSKKSYFLAGGRLARPKHIDLIVRACRELGAPLKVFGRGFAGWEEDTKILRYKDIKKDGKKSPNILVSQYPNIQFLGEVSEEEKLELMRNAKAYIFASEDEDFGITPVEAMSVGTPVIAYKSGGVVESVIDGKTGLFFDELSVESLSKAIKQFNRVKRDNAINPTDCIKQAQKFSKVRFKREIKEFVESKFGQK